MTATGVELARGNYLIPNGLGGYIIRQSDLSSWARCQLQKFYNDRAKVDPDAPQPASLSATAYGSVVHHCLHQLELMVHEGREDALEVALAAFEHYWHPQNIGAIAEPITEWIARQTFGGLRERGRAAITSTYELLRKDDSHPLALEYQFAVPLEIAGRQHTFTGTVDRLTIRRQYSKPYLGLDDYKSGRQPTYLRWHMQGTAYAWASIQPEFWSGWPDSGVGELATFDEDVLERLVEMFASWGYSLHSGTHRELPLASRRFRWINVKDIKFADGGWRTERDYSRLQLAVDAYIRACEAEIYSVNLDGEVCRYCPFQKTCAGTGLAPESSGAP